MYASEIERGMYEVDDGPTGYEHTNLTLSQNALPHVYPSEFIIVAIVLLAWLGAICVFVNKWAKIQIVEPSDHRTFDNNPMNLHTIKVVKKARDSVIYHNFSASHKRSIRVRQDRIARFQQTLTPSTPSGDATNDEIASEQNV